jgi:hypothetical protein
LDNMKYSYLGVNNGFTQIRFVVHGDPYEDKEEFEVNVMQGMGFLEA